MDGLALFDLGGIILALHPRHELADDTTLTYHFQTIDLTVMENLFPNASTANIGLRAIRADEQSLTEIRISEGYTTSLKSLKKAYPSYFLDTSKFITALEKMNSNCIDWGLINNFYQQKYS